MLMETLNNDPERIYQALAEQFGYGDQGETEPDLDEDDDNPVDPRLAQYTEMTEQMAEIMLAQQEQEQQAQEDQELEDYLTELTEKYGEYDNEYVLAHLNLGYSGEEAVEKYLALVGNVKSQQPAQPPRLLGGGGGLPSQAIDPAQLNNRDTRKLVADMLRAAQAEG